MKARLLTEVCIRSPEFSCAAMRCDHTRNEPILEDNEMRLGGKVCLITGTGGRVVFDWKHFGFSTPSARFDKIEGSVLLDNSDLTKIVDLSDLTAGGFGLWCCKAR